MFMVFIKTIDWLLYDDLSIVTTGLSLQMITKSIAVSPPKGLNFTTMQWSLSGN